MQRGAGVDGRKEWVGEINSEPGFIDVELGNIDRRVKPWNLGTHGMVIDEKIITKLIE